MKERNLKAVLIFDLATHSATSLEAAGFPPDVAQLLSGRDSVLPAVDRDEFIEKVFAFRAKLPVLVMSDIVPQDIQSNLIQVTEPLIMKDITAIKQMCRAWWKEEMLTTVLFPCPKILRDEFAAACRQRSTTVSEAIREMMQDYISNARR